MKQKPLTTTECAATMKMITTSSSGFVTNMIDFTFQRSSNINPSLITTNAGTLRVFTAGELPYNNRRSPRNGKLSISATSFLDEGSSPAYKAAMENARAELIEEYKEFIPESLSKIRLQKGFSQTALASIIGTSQSHVAKIEAKMLDVKFSTATKIADALAISLDQLRPLILLEQSENLKIETMASAL